LLYAERALRAGARGYVMKREAPKKLLKPFAACWRTTIRQRQNRRPDGRKICRGPAAATASPIEQLSNRELEVFQLLGLGHNTRQIADHLHVGSKPSRLLRPHQAKAQAANATELCAKPSAGRKPAGKIIRPRVGFTLQKE